jgi:hypothetical protein
VFRQQNVGRWERTKEARHHWLHYSIPGHQESRCILCRPAWVPDKTRPRASLLITTPTHQPTNTHRGSASSGVSKEWKQEALTFNVSMDFLLWMQIIESFQYFS